MPTPDNPPQARRGAPWWPRPGWPCTWPTPGICTRPAAAPAPAGASSARSCSPGDHLPKMQKARHRCGCQALQALGVPTRRKQKEPDLPRVRMSGSGSMAQALRRCVGDLHLKRRDVDLCGRAAVPAEERQISGDRGGTDLQDLFAPADWAQDPSIPRDYLTIFLRVLQDSHLFFYMRFPESYTLPETEKIQ